MFRLYKHDIEKMQQMTPEDAWAYYEEQEKRYQEQQRYNGWVGEEHNRISARFTWHLNLAMQPDDDEYILEHVKENFEKDDLYLIADWLKDYYYDIVYLDTQNGEDLREQRIETWGGRKTIGSRLSAVADAAISDMIDWVNWAEIARHVIDAVKWEEETEDAVDAGLED